MARIMIRIMGILLVACVELTDGLGIFYTVTVEPCASMLHNLP